MDYGFESFEVRDDGKGISQENVAKVGLKHWTSKLENFSQLPHVSTFGFRGEALWSLCDSSQVTILTRTAEEAIGTLRDVNSRHRSLVRIQS